MIPKYQVDMYLKLANMAAGGIKTGQMVVYSGGRRTGKSMITMDTLKSLYYQNNLCKEILLPESKYKFSRAKWHTAEIHSNAIWRFSDEYNQIIEWCTEHFGPHPKKHDAWSRWYVGLGYINFRDEADYALYMLRWA